jgi:hypothetical protein
MDHVERWLAPRELRAIVICMWCLSKTVWLQVPVASAGVTLLELAMWWRRLSSPGIVKEGKQKASCGCLVVSGGGRASSGGKGYLLYGPLVEVFRKNTLRSRGSCSGKGLAPSSLMVRSLCPNRPHQPQFHLRLMQHVTGHVEFTKRFHCPRVMCDSALWGSCRPP